MDCVGRQGQRVSLAGHIALGPGDTSAATQVARIGGAEAHGMLQPLPRVEGDGNTPLAVSLVCNSDTDRGKYAKREEILACRLYLGCTVLLARVHQQPL